MELLPLLGESPAFDLDITPGEPRVSFRKLLLLREGGAD
jgi:hypothetical protein